MTKKQDEYETFEHNMRELLKVPHDKIKAELEREKAGKKQKKSKHNGKNGKEHGRSN